MLFQLFFQLKKIVNFSVTEKTYSISVARALRSDINLVAIKGDLLRSQGYQFNHQEHRNDFLKYNK